MAKSAARIMVIVAHPQDPFERAGGTVARHLARGDEASMISLTTGVVTHAFNIFPPTGVSTRILAVSDGTVMRARP